MDKTMIVWSAPDERDQVWTEAVRVGEVGGNTLGFLGAQFSPGSKPGNFEIIGYSFSGAFHSWIQDGDHRWKPGVVMGGHFAPVKDLDWERGGRWEYIRRTSKVTKAEILVLLILQVFNNHKFRSDNQGPCSLAEQQMARDC